MYLQNISNTGRADVTIKEQSSTFNSVLLADFLKSIVSAFTAVLKGFWKTNCSIEHLFSLIVRSMVDFDS